MNVSVIGQQLLLQTPVLLVYAVGMAFCLLYFGRCPMPAVLALVGLGLGVATIIGYALMYGYLMQLREEQGWEMQRLAGTLQSLGVAATVTRAVGLALLVMAVFVGRGQQDAAHAPHPSET